MINIAMATDANQIDYMLNSAWIIQKQASGKTKFHFIVDSTLTLNKLKEKISKMNILTNYKIINISKITFFKSFFNLKVKSYAPLNLVYSSLFLWKIFPEVKKIIWIDNDVYVEGDINELWKFKLTERIAGATRNLKPRNN